MEIPPLRSARPIPGIMLRVREDLNLKMQEGGSLRLIHHELYERQGGKCFTCGDRLYGRNRTHGRTRVRRKVPAWELAKLELPAEEICRLANDKDNLVLIHNRCWRGKKEMGKLLYAAKQLASAETVERIEGQPKKFT